MVYFACWEDRCGFEKYVIYPNYFTLFICTEAIEFAVSVLRNGVDICFLLGQRLPFLIMQNANFLEWELPVPTAATTAKITVSVPKLFHLKASTFVISTLNFHPTPDPLDCYNFTLGLPM